MALLPLRAEQSAPDSAFVAVGEGVLLPGREVEVAARSSGIIVELPFQEGDRVGEGEALALLDAYQDELLVENQRFHMEEDKRSVESGRRLVERDVLSEDELRRRKREAMNSRTRFLMAERTVRDKKTPSPISGYVLRLYKEQGESVEELERIARVVDVDTLRVRMFLPGHYIQRVYRGQPARVVVEGMPDDQWSAAEVLQVDPVIDPGSGLFRLRLQVDEPGPDMISGSRVKVFLPLAE